MPHILIVDDETDVLKSLGDVLQGEGFTVSLAKSAQEALNILGESHPDCIVLDVIMPEMDGFELCRHIRQQPALADIPIVFMTAKGRPADMISGYDAGANDYLTKPFDVLELPKRISALLH